MTKKENVMTKTAGKKSERVVKTKEYKTGDIIKLGKREMDIIETFREKQRNLSVMFDVLAGNERDYQERLWNTIRDLYPGVEKFDLYANWKKREITIRGILRKENE